MKKILVSLLLACMLCPMILAAAEKLTPEAFNELIPPSANLDFSVFTGSDVYFQNLTFTGYASPGIKLGINGCEAYLHLNYYALDSVIYVNPSWYAYAHDAKHYDYFVVMGQNRYRIEKDALDAPLGQTGFAMLKEMASYEGDVQIACEYNYKVYTLTDADKAALQTFVNQCEQSGVVPLFPQESNVIVITQFN